MPLAVAAVGGNAIVGAVGDMTSAMARLAALGWDLVVTHGNGPQVGELLLDTEGAAALHAPAPLDVVDAETQGALGYQIQQALGNALRAVGIGRTVVSIVTQVVVDPDDPAFLSPAKPIGPFFDRPRAQVLSREKGWVMVEDAGRGYRRAVPSPEPLEIVEWPAIRTLLAAHVVVVAAGGGGIPVAKASDGRLAGVEAVVDKDRASALLGRLLAADLLLVLTGVPEVFLDFGRPSQRPLRRLSVAEARALLAAGQFASGSMAPKVEAAAGFTEATGQPAVITSPARVLDALAGTGGTTLHP